MLTAFDGVYLIKVDGDDWGWHFGRFGFDFDAFPIFYKLDANGKPTGEVLDGNAWGANIPKNMAPALDRFFHGDD